MKKTILPILLCLLLAACSDNSSRTEETSTTTDTLVAQSAQTAPTDIPGAMKSSMDKMTSELKSYQPSGDPDHDFASIMRIHHQGAVEMMQAYLPGAKDEMLKTMTQNGISKQQSEIGELGTFLNGHQPGTQKSSYGKDAAQMVTDMMVMETTPQDLDKAFATMMAPHHESAVHISQMFLNHGKDEKLKAMAKKIASEQQKETDELKKWLQEHP
ncbi:DUF305 domain-containing protein [Polluticoccus soli]|uniref:DUF305 domain-containing protein n=1 Tax=Polluticoccus soli TaxID=3034150 RepID=UPI0023E34136|nr:DUF305 domain-containing protein [Flavipsychrobacter sp. JY13-12]